MTTSTRPTYGTLLACLYLLPSFRVNEGPTTHPKSEGRKSRHLSPPTRSPLLVSPGEVETVRVQGKGRVPSRPRP